LIRRLAAENCLWGAPRIHGELLKLGIVVSERTVSRYLPCRLRAPSQTWRTFLANHVGPFTFISPETSLCAPGDDDVGDESSLTFRHTPLSCDARSASHQCAVDKGPSLQRTLPGKHLVQAYLHDGISIRTSGGRGPPTHGRFGRPTRMHRESIGAPARDLCATNDGVRRLTARPAARYRGQRRRQTNHLRSGAVCTSAWVVHRSRNIGEAQASKTLRQSYRTLRPR
jgi:hypothetical protein